MKHPIFASKLQICSTTAVVLALSACGSDHTSSAPPQHQAHALASTSKSSPSPSPAASAWIQSPQKHSNSGISMRYRLEGNLAVGQPVTVHMEFSGARSADAQIKINPAKTLTVGSGAGLQKSGDQFGRALKLNETTGQSITVTPTSEGAHFISIGLYQNGQSSAAGIMLRVGAAGQKTESMGELVTTPSGEKLIVVPAQ